MKKRVLTALAVLTGMFLLSVSIVWAAPVNLAKTGQTTSYADGDDGYYEKGVAWPSPRFKDHGDGTVTDNLTGLMWAKNANLADGKMSWNDAIDYSYNLGLGSEGCGTTYTGWRLPNIKELQSLIDFGHELINNNDVKLPTGHPFVNVELGPYYWSSTSNSNEDNDTNSTTARTMGMGSANENKLSKVHSTWVWPVRGETVGSPAPVPKTGQTYSYRTGDDGDLQTGAEVQGDRFSDHNDGTVTDNLTGLMWTKEVTHEEGMNWNGVIDYANDLSYGGAGCGSGYNDWRLPNIWELRSLIDYGNYAPALTAGHPFIVNSHSGHTLWTSTTRAKPEEVQVYVSRILDGDPGVSYKRDYANRELWLVRGGN
jgi:hypothetical protein